MPAHPWDKTRPFFAKVSPADVLPSAWKKDFFYRLKSG
jgi:hypothetical protein